ncbi:MAG TPA: PrgI family protein [Candidatus Saccharimonadales bacterium]|jgi:hypothetical protein
MATYKVIQDVEAEDKLVGPLTLRQFIYAGIAALSIYLGFLSATKGAAFMLVVFVPITGVCGFFAFPWGQDQPTEVWALARIRFMVKPRKRIWDQSGAKELVKVTAPPVVEHRLTNGLSLDEVHSRLNALANTIDSRGWAIKNANVNIAVPETELPNLTSDRLAQPSTLGPATNLAADVTAADDMLDETANPIAHKFGNMITAADANHRQQIIAQLQMPGPSLPALPQAPPQPPADYWFMQGGTPTVNTPGQAVFGSDPVVAPGAQTFPGTRAAAPTPDEEALIEKLKSENQRSGMSAAYGHLKTLKTPEQLAEEARRATTAPVPAPAPTVTPHAQAAIINLANNDDLDVATIARQAQAQVNNDGEVVISLR